MTTGEYEVYAQPPNESVLTAKKRYYTTDRDKAFSYMVYLNKTEGNYWRVAKRIKNRIIFDIDNDNIDNVKAIVKYYSKVFGELRVYKTNTGYHIHSKRYTNEWEWHYDCCRVLNPLLESKDILKYLGKLKDWYNNKLKEEFELKWSRKQYIDNIKNTFPDSGLYCGIGDFDIVFALMVLFKGYYCVRISKKSETDKPVRVM